MGFWGFGVLVVVGGWWLVVGEHMEGMRGHTLRA